MANANESMVELVTFRASGLEEINSRLKAFQKETEEAQRRQKALMGLMNDPKYQQHAQKIATINRQTELMALKLRNVQLAADVASGALGRHTAATAKLNAEHAKLQKQANLQALIAEHGKFGGLLKHHAAEFATLKNVATLGYLSLTGMAVGLVHAGLQGTVEGARLSTPGSAWAARRPRSPCPPSRSWRPGWGSWPTASSGSAAGSRTWC
jgi:hypothetical protein